jgi:hypothetical protein
MHLDLVTLVILVEKFKLMWLLMTQCSCFFYFLYLGPDINLSTLFLNTLNLCYFINVRGQALHSYKMTGDVVLYILLVTFLGSSQEYKRFRTS